jgi:hypothetical protein
MELGKMCARDFEMENQKDFSDQSDKSKKIIRLQNDQNSIIIGFTFFACLLVFSIFAALPVTEIVMGAIHRNDITCETDIVDISTWLIVKGATGLFVVVFLVVAILAASTENEFFSCLAVSFVTPFVFACMFSFAWLIVGSVVFWRDCSHLEPRPVNTLMWCSLIIGYVSIYIQWTTSNKNEK